MTEKFLIIIPSRLASTRLPNKPLADICGKSMIQRVYEQAVAANLGEVIIACDGEEIAQAAKKFGAKFIITNPNLPSGTDRIYEAFKSFGSDAEIIVNLQGDLPNIDPQIIRAAANCAANYDCDIATVASKIIDPQEVENSNVVKIAISENGRALYFSRAKIPYSKKDSDEYFHHIGIYAYKKAALKKFVNLNPSKLEQRESLEQLRALENGMTIAVKVVDSHPISVDTAQDLEVLRSLIGR